MKRGFRRARKAAHIKLFDAATLLGVSRQTVSAWERGDFEPGLESLEKMSRVYDCSVDALLTADEPGDVVE